MRAAYGYDVDKASDEAGTVPKGKSLTVQSQAEEADINTIVQRFGLTGDLPLNQRVPLNIDFDEILDYQSCANAVLAARRSYESMPVALRNRVNNDPGALVDFVLDPANRAECVKFGLVVEPVPAIAPGTPAGPQPSPGAPGSP